MEEKLQINIPHWAFALTHIILQSKPNLIEILLSLSGCPLINISCVNLKKVKKIMEDNFYINKNKSVLICHNEQSLNPY